MVLPTGTRLGPYEVRALLGSGGMGDVYVALDARLRREVAIKVLPSSAASDPSRLQRFEQEAHAAGALNHPNVLAVYDVGTQDGLAYIVSERLEGESLRARLSSGALPPRKAIEYAVQTAHGLSAAHERGIVHRDLKPENVFLCDDGTVKILDFGIAKLLHGALGRADDDTISMATTPGAIIGTAAYMSPEQIRGESIDARSDIFALGIVLYEMLSSRRPFGGDTIAEVQTAILREDSPRLSTARGISEPLDRIVRRCLEKQPKDRFDTARDVALALEAVSLSTEETPPPRFRQRRAFLHRAALVAAGLVAGAAIGVPVYRVLSPIKPPAYTQLTFRRGTLMGARFVPDGQTVVYSAAWDGEPTRVFSTRLGGRESRDLGIEGFVEAVSKNGDMLVKVARSLGGVRAAVLARVSLSGGAPRELANGVLAADWDREGQNIAVLREVGGRNVLEYPMGRVVYQGTGRVLAFCMLSRNRFGVFERVTGGAEPQFAVSVVDQAGSRTELSRGWRDWAGPLVWSPSTNEILFPGSMGGDASLFAVSLTGKTRLVASVPGDFRLEDVDAEGRILLTRNFARGGVVGLAPGETQERDLSWLDFSFATALSADGRQLLLTDIGGGFGGTGAIAIRRTDGSPAVEIGRGTPFALSPDARYVLASPIASGPADRLLVVPVGAGERRELRHGLLPNIFNAAWSPDGNRVVVAAGTDESHAQLYLWDVRGANEPRRFSPEGSFGSMVVAPDGRAVAAMKADGPLSLYAIDGSAPRRLPGAEEDDEPLAWSSDGSWLFVRRGSDLPARVDRLEIATGKRIPWKELRPAERSGVFGISSVVVTPDGRSYAYTFASSLATLYLAEGLK